MPFDSLSVLVVGGGAVCLPSPPSWFSFSWIFQGEKKVFILLNVCVLQTNLLCAIAHIAVWFSLNNRSLSIVPVHPRTNTPCLYYCNILLAAFCASAFTRHHSFQRDPALCFGLGSPQFFHHSICNCPEQVLEPGFLLTDIQVSSSCSSLYMPSLYNWLLEINSIAGFELGGRVS